MIGFEYSCVFITLLLCIWSLIVGIRSKEWFPFGQWGRAVLIINSIIVGLLCWATLAYRIIEIFK